MKRNVTMSIDIEVINRLKNENVSNLVNTYLKEHVGVETEVKEKVNIDEEIARLKAIKASKEHKLEQEYSKCSYKRFYEEGLDARKPTFEEWKKENKK